jgi:hypothetical protein
VIGKKWKNAEKRNKAPVVVDFLTIPIRVLPVAIIPVLAQLKVNESHSWFWTMRDNDM